MPVEHGIVQIAAREKIRQGVADEFGDAQHALRRLAARLMMGSGHVISRGTRVSDVFGNPSE